MKRFLLTLLVLLAGTGAASAQRLQIGLRGGVNVTDYRFTPTQIGDIRFSPGADQTGGEAGLVLRLNLWRHLHIQSEFNYAFVNYSVRANGATRRDVRLHTERFEIPLQLGFQFGVVRIFGGVQFRVADDLRSSAPNMLKVGFNNGDVGLTGGLGLNIGKFFIDFRVSGYPRSHVWQTLTSYGEAERVRVSHDIVYGGSIGFFF